MPLGVGKGRKNGGKPRNRRRYHSKADKCISRLGLHCHFRLNLFGFHLLFFVCLGVGFGMFLKNIYIDLPGFECQPAASGRLPLTTALKYKLLALCI